MTVRTLLRVPITAVFLLFALAAFADSTFIKFGASWKYLDNGSNQGTTWKDLDSRALTGWKAGSALFGYGYGFERTRVSYGDNASNKHMTTYFKNSFNITNLAQYTSFDLGLYLDDGAVVYINGIEVSRINMPVGPIAFNTRASSEIMDQATIILPVSLPVSGFKSGYNEIAVEVHQHKMTSDDLTFDLRLAARSGSVPVDITRGPLLQMVSTDAITIKWRTSTATTSAIRYGISENELTGIIKDNDPTMEHEMRITGLRPDQKYFYSVGTTEYMIEGSYRNHFFTAPLATTKRKIRIGVFGDAGTGIGFQKPVRDGYLKLFKKDESPDLALLLGDNAYNFGTDLEHQSNFFNIYDDNLLDNHPVFPVPGNHEYYSPGVPYFSIFSLPAAGESGGVPSGTESYYSFNYGNIHIIMLNSMGFDHGKPLYDSTGAQALWLKKDLAANAGTHKWTIVCMHHPPYSNGTHSSDGEPNLVAIRQQITPILERYGVDAVFAGHSHVYERSFLIQGHSGNAASFNTAAAPIGNMVSGSSAKYDGSENSCPYFTIDTAAKQGTVYVVAGSAGQIGGGNNAQFPLFYYKNYSGTPGGEPGALYLEVQDNRLDAKFIGFSGTVRDQFTIMKGVNTKKTISVEVNNTVDLTASWVGAYNWLPTPAPGKDGLKTLSVTPSKIDTVTYLVRDSIGLSKTCISDTFMVRSFAGVLPVNTIYEAVQKNNKIIVKWKIQHDPRTDYYTIARSSNGTDYDMLTIVKASAGASGSVYYEFEDNYPLRGKNYYRLIQTNKNGQNLLIGIRELDFDPKQNFTFSIKSAPESKMINLNVHSFKKQLLGIKLFDMNGRCIYKTSLMAFEGNMKDDIRVNPGVYVLSITAYDGKPVTERIMVR